MSNLIESRMQQHGIKYFARRHPLTLGMGSIGQNSSFSEHDHVAYQFNGAITYKWIRVTDAKRTEKMQKMFILCSSGDESCLLGDDSLRGTCKERIKCMSNAYVTDK